MVKGAFGGRYLSQQQEQQQQQQRRRHGGDEPQPAKSQPQRQPLWRVHVSQQPRLDAAPPDLPSRPGQGCCEGMASSSSAGSSSSSSSSSSSNSSKGSGRGRAEGAGGGGSTELGASSSSSVGGGARGAGEEGGGSRGAHANGPRSGSGSDDGAAQWADEARGWWTSSPPHHDASVRLAEAVSANGREQCVPGEWQVRQGERFGMQEWGKGAQVRGVGRVACETGGEVWNARVGKGCTGQGGWKSGRRWGWIVWHLRV